MNSLWFKLIGAFTAVIAVTLGVVILVINVIAARQFDLYVARSGEVFARNLAPLLARSYDQNGDWSEAPGIIANPLAYSDRDAAPPSGPNGQGQNPNGPRGQMGSPTMWQEMGFEIMLADVSGIVVADSSDEMIGQTLNSTLIDQGVPIMVRGSWVGTLLVVRPEAGNTARAQYLAQVQRAAIFAGIAAGIVALGAGTLIFRRVIEPLRSLQSAAHQVAQGDLSARVPVTSNDELTDVARSFNTMAENLSQQNKIRKQMVADIAHELRTPITVMQGTLEAMQDGLIPPTPEELGDLHGDVRRLGRLVEDLRTLSLADAGQLTLEKDSVNIGHVAEHVANRLAAFAVDRGIALNVDAQANLPLVHADEDRITQVVMNLVNNALRYTPRGGSVLVRARQNQRHVVLEVSDTGPGIAEHDQPYIFERFWRGDKSRSRESGGSGLGLAIVRHLVEMQGGTIGVESRVGSGSTFKVSLPAKG